MPARRVTSVTVPVDGRSLVAFDAYRDRTPLLSVLAPRSSLVITLTLPDRIDAGHVRFARDLAVQAARVRYRSRAGLPWPGDPSRPAPSRCPRDEAMAPSVPVTTGQASFISCPRHRSGRNPPCMTDQPPRRLLTRAESSPAAALVSTSIPTRRARGAYRLDLNSADRDDLDRRQS